MNEDPANGYSSLKRLPAMAGFFLLLTSPATLQAQNENYPAGTRSAALSNASVSLSDAWSSFNNQAGLAFVSSPVIALHFENRYSLKELSMQAGSLALPFKPGTFAACYRFFGFSKYYEGKLGLAYARKFTSRFSAGVQVDYLQTHIQDIENRHAISAEIGLMAEPLKSLIIGFHIFNPFFARQNVPGENNKLPTILRYGMGYHFDRKATLLLEMEKKTGEELLYKGGFELNVPENFFFRMGFSSGYELYSFGLGYKYKKFMIDLAFSQHYMLGLSPHVSLEFEF